MADPARTLRYLRSHPGVNLRRYELLTILVDFIHNARDDDDPTRRGTHGATPSKLGWWKLFNQEAARYGFCRMAYSTFLGHLTRLKEEGYISEKRGVLCVERAQWKAPDDLPLVKVETTHPANIVPDNPVRV